ncbi:MAG: SMP-30/gluconolactonase/LRE family protein, partial [bacterium]
MKKSSMVILAGMILVLTSALLSGGAMSQSGRLNVRGIGLQTPESVLYDAAADVYLVANINGNPTATDDNGFISRIAPSGRVLSLKWIDGRRGNVTLSAPKGMAIVGNTLYVADITAVRMFDRRTGRQRGSIAIAGSTFLNDVAAGPDGAVYVTDSGLNPDFSPNGTDAVYRIAKNGKVTAVARGASLKGPNGVTVLRDGRVFVVTFSQTGETYSLGMGGQPENVKRMPKGQLDGVIQTRSGALLISSWAASTVYRVDRQGNVTVAVANVPSPADIGYDSRRQRVLIPIFMENRLV